MKRVFLHIGHGKTGTSFVQSFLALNVGVLNSCGIDYPSHRGLAPARKGCLSSGNLGGVNDWREHIINESEKSHFEDIIFSNETLFHRIVSAPADIREL